MNALSIVIIICLVMFAGIGFLVGYLKGFTAVKSWAVEYLFSALFSIALGALFHKTLGERGGAQGGTAGILTLLFAIALMIVFTVLCMLLRKLFTKKIAACEKRSYYEQYEDREENKEQILDAIYDNDEPEYKRLVKEEEKFKPKQGGWRIADRVVGGVTLMIEAIVITGIISSVILMFLDLANFPSIAGRMSGIYSSGSWKLAKNHLLDFFIIGLILACIKCGYSSGISSALWSFVVIFLVIGAGALAHYFAFKVEAFERLAENLNLPDTLANLANSLSQIGMSVSATKLSQFFIMLGLFAVFIVVVIITAIFVPRALRAARESEVFYAIDGGFGAAALTVIMIAVLLFGGAVFASVSDFEFIQPFSSYFDKSVVANYFYQDNIAVLLGIAQPSLLRGWLGG